MSEENVSGEVVSEPKKRHVKRNVLIVVAVIVVIALAVLAFMVFKGAIAPSSAACKYDTLSYIDEDDVTSYIETYREQTGYGDSDEDWAQFMADNELTPARIRYTTIRQLIIDAEVAEKAEEDGITVKKSELDEYVESMKNAYGMGSDEIWKKTLKQYGQTEAGLRASYKQTLLQEKLFTQEVPVPEATDTQTVSYLSYYVGEGTTAKHIYYMKIKGLDEDNGYEKFSNIQTIRKDFLEDGVSAENFETYAGMFCTDSALKKRGGANGWDVDMDDMSDNYQSAVNNTEVGEVSNIFREDDGYAFVYIDKSYTLPTYFYTAKNGKQKQVSGKKYMAKLPDTLAEYYRDCAGQMLWKEDCQDYLQELYENSNPVFYDMPSDVSYNVDMSNVTTSTDSTDSTDSSDSSSSSSSSDSDSADSSSGSSGGKSSTK